MRGVTRRRIYFVISLLILISILASLIWNLFLPKLEGVSVFNIIEPAKSEFFGWMTMGVLGSLLVLMAAVYFIDREVSED